jgi:hypothetical protein
MVLDRRMAPALDLDADVSFGLDIEFFGHDARIDYPRIGKKSQVPHGNSLSSPTVAVIDNGQFASEWQIRGGKFRSE